MIETVRQRQPIEERWIRNIYAYLGVYEPGKLKQDLTKLLFIVGLCMGCIFICRQIAIHPPATGPLVNMWPALLAWVPVFLFTPPAIYLLDRLHTKGS